MTEENYKVKPYRSDNCREPNRASRIVSGSNRLTEAFEKFPTKRDEKEGCLIFRKIDLVDIEHFRKSSFRDVNLEGYQIGIANLGWGRVEDIDGGRIFPDVAYHFILTHKSHYLATLGFEPQNEAILACQIQGVPRREKLLSPIKWANLLLNTAQKWAFDNKIPEVWVLPHFRNISLKIKTNNKTPESDEKGGPTPKMFYDVTARREGFKFDEEMGVYRKSTRGFGIEQGLITGLESLGVQICDENSGIVRV